MKKISYEPLWKTMERKNVTQYKLIKEGGISNVTLHKLKENKNLTLETLMKICTYLRVKPNDVVKFIETEDQ